MKLSRRSSPNSQVNTPFFIQIKRTSSAKVERNSARSAHISLAFIYLTDQYNKTALCLYIGSFNCTAARTKEEKTLPPHGIYLFEAEGKVTPSLSPLVEHLRNSWPFVPRACAFYQAISLSLPLSMPVRVCASKL